jgi:hypothetical protein
LCNFRWHICIISKHGPKECCFLRLFLLNLYCHGYYTLGITYLMKVFSLLSLIRNLENFTTKRITTALISCIVMWLCTYLCIHPILSKCGVLYRLFLVGHSRASYQINGNQLHTFFILLPHHSGAYGFERFLLTQNINAYANNSTEELPRP